MMSGGARFYLNRIFFTVSSVGLKFGHGAPYVESGILHPLHSGFRRLKRSPRENVLKYTLSTVLYIS